MNYNAAYIIQASNPVEAHAIFRQISGRLYEGAQGSWSLKDNPSDMGSYSLAAANHNAEPDTPIAFGEIQRIVTQREAPVLRPGEIIERFPNFAIIDVTPQP